MIDRLVLGTAQLGMRHGVNNKIGKPDFDEAFKIVKTAFDAGIFQFDTAQVYGNSEEVLGKIFSELKISAQVKVYSKLAPELDLNNAPQVADSVKNSLEKLTLNQLEGLMLHREEMLDAWNDKLRSTLSGLVQKGKVKKIGISFYTPGPALRALDIDAIDFLQIPANLLDQRFKNQGVIEKAHRQQKQLFIRSIYLQGLLVMPPKTIPERVSFTRDFIQKFSDLAAKLGVTPQQLAVDHIKRVYPDSFIVVGAEDYTQIAETVKLFRSQIKIESHDNDFRDIPEKVVNPLLWPRPSREVSDD